MDKVQGLRDLVRPIITIMITFAYLTIVGMVTWQGKLEATEAIASVGTPFLMILSYHFAKASKKDST